MNLAAKPRPTMATLIATAVWIVGASAALADEALGNRPQIMVVGAYHLVSKNNVNNMPVDDPLLPKRQTEIEDLVAHLARFHPAKIVLEETTGSSHIEEHYRRYLAGTWQLERSENYQIGFRLAKSLGHRRVYLINAHTEFDYERVTKFASSHAQGAIMAEKARLDEDFMTRATRIAQEGTVLQLYRFYNTEQSIRENNAAYMYLARIGDDEHFVGANLVANWHLRNLEMFAKLTRLVEGQDDRVLVLYGQGHSFLLRQFIRESPDLQLVDAGEYLQ